MNLTAFVIAICSILAVLLLCGIALVICENLLERKLIENGYSKYECKKDYRKKKAVSEEEPSAEAEPETESESQSESVSES